MNRKKRNVPDNVKVKACKSDFSLDELTGYCYKYENTIVNGNAYEGQRTCQGKYTGAEFVKFIRDDEVQGFINLVVSGALSNKEFFVGAWRLLSHVILSWFC